MWQVMRSCFRFDQNTKRVRRLFYCASICLFEHKSTTNHTASITPTYPQEVVITYTIVCSSRQAASNPIGLNLHFKTSSPAEMSEYVQNLRGWIIYRFKRLNTEHFGLQAQSLQVCTQFKSLARWVSTANSRFLFCKKGNCLLEKRAKSTNKHLERYWQTSGGATQGWADKAWLGHKMEP